MGEGRTAVLAPVARLAALRERLLGVVEPGPDTPDGPADPEVDLTSPVVALPSGKAKGLEFDAVVLVEPVEVLAESPRGVNDLYVALTRATQRLAVVHAEPLPGKVTMTVPQGALIVHEQAGAGGFGDPRQRNPALVREDLADGTITPEFARRRYGMVPD